MIVEGGSELSHALFPLLLGRWAMVLIPARGIYIQYNANDMSPTIPRQEYFRHIEAIFPTRS